MAAYSASGLFYMSESLNASVPKPSAAVEFWDAMAPHLSKVENSYLDVPTTRRIIHELVEPVLVIGGGQGLIVEAIRKHGLQCDGVDLSAEMIRHAQLRRGITLTHADAKSLPLASETYSTVVYATGVIDFTGDEQAIAAMLKEGRRILKEPGRMFVAFYRISDALESFSTRVGLLSNHEMALRKSFELYLLNPGQMIAWVAKQTGLGYLQAAALVLRMSARSTLHEKWVTFQMQKICRRIGHSRSLIKTAPEKLPYRDESEIRNLFARLGLHIKQFKSFAACYIVQIE